MKIKMKDLYDGKIYDIDYIRFENGEPVEVWNYPNRNQYFNYDGMESQFELIIDKDDK